MAAPVPRAIRDEVFPDSGKWGPACEPQRHGVSAGAPRGKRLGRLWLRMGVTWTRRHSSGSDPGLAGSAKGVRVFPVSKHATCPGGKSDNLEINE